MYNFKEIADRIKISAKEKGISLKDLLLNLNLNINTVSELSKGKAISFLSIANIADVLDVSVDYLLGRTENKFVDVATNEEYLLLIAAYKAKPSMQAAVRQLLGVERPANKTAETTEFPPFTGRLVAADGTNIGEAVPNTKKPKIRTT